jgi:hypothetical protein
VGTYFGQLLAQRVPFLVYLVDVQVSNRPAVYLTKQRHASGCEHGTDQLDELILMQMVPAVYGLQNLDSSL